MNIYSHNLSKQSVAVLIAFLSVLFLLISCSDNSKEKKEKNVNSTQQKLFDIAYTQQKTIYTIGDSIPLTIKTSDKSLSLDSIEFRIDNQLVECSKNNNIITLLTDSVKQVGAHSISAVYNANETTHSTFLQLTLLSDISPKEKKVSVLKTFPHDNHAYTQGLELHNNILYESTGLRGQSTLRKVNLTTGEVIQTAQLSVNYFAEGITILDNIIYQITWQSQTGFAYELESFKQIKQFSYPTEGWGLTNNGSELIMSDGSNNLYFLDKVSLAETKRISVFDNYNAITQLNELEYVDGFVYANVYTKDYIVKIDIETGKVVEKIDCNGLLTHEEKKYPVDVLNGIAYNAKQKTFYITGKNWPKLFEVTFINK